MKKLMLLAIATIMSVGAINAMESSKKSDKLTVTEYTTNIDCPNCAKKVMNVVPFQKGVKDVDVNLESKVVTVTYDSKKSSNETIQKSLEKLDVKVLGVNLDEKKK